MYPWSATRCGRCCTCGVTPSPRLSVAALAFALCAYQRDRSAGRIGFRAPLWALLCGWLQPWQGATLLGILVVSELAFGLGGAAGRWRLPVVTGIAAALPLLYYGLLSHLDPVWARSGHVNSGGVPLLSVVVSLVPLGLPALLAYRFRPRSFQSVAVHARPVVALAVYAVIDEAHVGTYPLHALQGLSLPLAVLAVAGLSTLRIPLGNRLKVLVGTAVVVALLLPSGLRNLNSARSVGNTSVFGREPYFITAGEERALTYLGDAPLAGAVLAPEYLGQVVPAETGRKTWVGIFSWTPDYDRRVSLTEALFSGELSSAESVELVDASGARFLLADCQHPHDLSGVLGPVLLSVRHFGCATVYRVAVQSA